MAVLVGLLDELHWFPGGSALLAAARAERPQKDGMCGAFVTLVSLRVHGIRLADQDEAAAAAGTVLLADARATLPEGEPGRADFRLDLPRTEVPAAAGTSAAGIATAVETLSGGALRAVPAAGDWTASKLGRLLDLVHLLPRVAVIANVDTAELGAQDTPEQALRDYLETGMPPLWASRWRVGHFALIGGTLIGDGGTLVSIVDTYASLGRDGVHLQLVENLANALLRKGMSPGGLLLVVAAEQAGAAANLVESTGLLARPWDSCAS
ncbi:DUF6885 family protein [Amycolatopsis nigrescens]|uniref:DUF6885 family protein n=1 Tax=Amycolatopsis nigrescens TaxID=381445 RepID=UPI001FE09CFF|nr:hypothetical protein [Amycolatopsis nigrescens]